MRRRTILRFLVMMPAIPLPIEAARLGSLQDSGSTGRIEWNPARQLRWQDFGTKPPRGAQADCHSFVGFDIAWSCDLDRFAFHVTTTFDPNQSWVRPGAQQADLLRHEQTHFDLTEVAARQLRQRLTALADPCASYAVMGDVNRAVTSERGSWEQEQQRYDRETANGTNLTNQQRWNARTAERLTLLKAFE